MSEIRVLIIEDERPLREILTARLQRDGFVVDAASDGEGWVELQHVDAVQCRTETTTQLTQLIKSRT